MFEGEKCSLTEVKANESTSQHQKQTKIKHSTLEKQVCALCYVVE